MEGAVADAGNVLLRGEKPFQGQSAVLAGKIVEMLAGEGRMKRMRAVEVRRVIRVFAELRLGTDRQEAIKSDAGGEDASVGERQKHLRLLPARVFEADADILADRKQKSVRETEDDPAAALLGADDGVPREKRHRRNGIVDPAELVWRLQKGRGCDPLAREGIFHLSGEDIGFADFDHDATSRSFRLHYNRNRP